MKNSSIRDLPKMQEIKEFLCKMKFPQKMLGGCDKEDVLRKLETLTLMYQEVLDWSDRQITEAEDQIQGLLAETVRMEAKVKQVQEEAEGLKSQMGTAVKDQRNYQKKAQLLTDAMLKQEQERSEVMERARREAQKLIYQAETRAKERARQCHQEVEQQLQDKQKAVMELDREIAQLSEEKSALLLEIKTSMQVISGEVALIQAKAKDLDEQINNIPSPEPDSAEWYEVG